VLSLMLALVPAAFAAEPASGTCGAEGDGSNVTWTLDASGTLTFTGTGAMRDYTAQSGTPWGRSGNAIQAVVVQEGITHIGAYAFFTTRIAGPSACRPRWSRLVRAPSP
ncbi:MAG: hypothetical protein U0O13_08900, partial [Oscillospiraceae bacterium]